MIETEFQVLLFTNISDLDSWLSTNHATSKGVWIRFAKKQAKLSSITYDQALDLALCYGWIDSKLLKYDDQTYIQKFTPRRDKSVWSKTNIERILRLQKLGKLKPAGLHTIELAKQHGFWKSAYDPQSRSVMPEDFLTLLVKNAKAYDFFKTLNKTNLYSISWRIQTAKNDKTRTIRMQNLIVMLSEGKKFH